MWDMKDRHDGADGGHSMHSIEFEPGPPHRAMPHQPICDSTRRSYYWDSAKACSVNLPTSTARSARFARPMSPPPDVALLSC